MGTPSTIPAETPIITLETALGASSLETEAPATDMAIETYTGWKKAGITRAATTTGKVVAKAEIKLHPVNTPNTNSMVFFRLIREKSSGMVGPAKATIKANRLTTRPAVATVTPYSSATRGNIPTTPISVLMILNTPSVRMKMIPFVTAIPPDAFLWLQAHGSIRKKK